MEQRSVEWFQARLGKITGSRFGDVLTEPRSKKDKELGVLSKTAESYMLELITEKLVGEPRKLSGEALDWGTNTEPEAIEYYEMTTFNEVEAVGFVEINEDVGGSPDGLVETDGMIEVKCPFTSANHVKYFLGASIPKGYYAQIQGNLWVTDRKWCDFISYDPRIKDPKKRMFILRVERDEDFIKNLESKIASFIVQLNSKLEKLK